MPQIPSHLWSIHGKFYDFNSFVDKHPGGSSFILTGRGRECTELFESVHALCDSDVKKMIEVYRVKEADLISAYSDDKEMIVTEQEDYFNWEPKGFYATLKERVRQRLAGDNYKATWGYWIKVPIMMTLAFYCLYEIYRGSYKHAFMYGCLIEMLGFCVMHDASHGAVSKKSWINEYCSIVWNSWAQWSHFLWMQHHVWAHHSYTSIYLKDPDIVHWGIFLRKAKEQPHFPFHKYQSKYWWYIVGFWPTQHMGQMITYYLSMFQNYRLFGMPVLPWPKSLWSLENNIRILSIVVHFVGPYIFLPWKVALTCQFLWLLGMGLSYWLMVAPNHDTMASHHALVGTTAKGMDWGELQVRSSCSHSQNPDSVVDSIITLLWGGMNYQIEHHLFPSLSHCHYYKVSPIVQDTCKEFNIPYPCYKTWFDAMKSWVAFLGEMETK